MRGMVVSAALGAAAAHTSGKGFAEKAGPPRPGDPAACFSDAAAAAGRLLRSVPAPLAAA